MTDDTKLTPGENKAEPDAGANQAAKKIELSEDEFNAKIEERLVRDRKARDAELKDLKAKAKQWDEAEKAKLSELDRLKADLAERDKLLADKDSELSGLKLERVKAAKLAAAKVPSEWIDSVAGTTEEEVEASVAKIAARLKLETPIAAQGAGNPGVVGQPGKKTWKQSEIRRLLSDPSSVDPAVLKDINLAEAERRIDYNA